MDGAFAGGVVEVPLERLRCWSGNPRRISPARLEDLQRALVADPAMLWARSLIALLDGTVICGNQKLQAAQALGWLTIPVLYVDLEPGRARQWALRDNNTWGEWDEVVLGELLAEFVAETDPDELPPLPDGPSLSQPGEVYELGEHRLLCGDCRDEAALALLTDGERVEVLLTDPPFGVDYVGKTRRALRIRNDQAARLPDMLREAFRAVDEVLAASARFYVFAPAGPAGTEFRLAIRDTGWSHHQTLCWVKDAIVLGHSDFHFQHEEVLYGYLPGPGRPGRGRHRGSRWFGGNDQSSVLFADRPKRSAEHPTMKPVALLEAMLRNSSRRGDLVLDPFAGSGSTMIACERLGRRCVAVEIDPAYCDVVRRRFKEHCDDRG